MGVLKRWASEHEAHLKSLGWTLAQGLIGAAVGLAAVALYLRGQGC